MNNDCIRKTLLLFFLFISSQIMAYETEQLGDYQQKFPDQMAVVLDHTQSVSIEVDETTGELLIYITDYEEVLYLKEASKFYTSQSIYTSDFFEDILDLNVTVYNERGKRKKLGNADSKIVDSPPSSWVFHDDDKELIFDLQSLGEGFRTVIEYKKRVKRPEFFDVFHFMSGYPIEKSRIEIAYAKGVELKFYEQNMDDISIVREENELKKERKQVVWQVSDLPEYKTEKGSIDVRYHIPHLVAQIASYTTRVGKTDVIGTTDQLHGFFQELLLLRDVDGTNTRKTYNGKGDSEADYTEMNEVVAEITKDLTTDLEKMDTIFRWVQDNIKYIAFEDGINGYVPRACSEVMSNRFGDCKDMGNLLVEMLNFAEVEGGHVAWVGTRDIPYQMSEIPTPLACNHVICVVDKPDGGYYYLDATNAEGGYLLPPRNLLNKELLIHNGMDDYTIYKIPAVDANDNYIKSYIRYRWDENDSIRGTGTDLYGGYERESRTYYLSNLDKEDLRDYVKDMVLGGFNRYTLQDFEIKNLPKKNEELAIEYDFAVDNLFLEDGEDLIINPTLFKPRVTQYNLNDHSMTRRKKSHRTIDYNFEFEIPEGYKVKHLPENSEYNHKLFDFQSEFKTQENLIVVHMKYQYHLLEIPTELYSEWNAFSTAINNATIQNVILQPIQ